jgi:hypothetical protein
MSKAVRGWVSGVWLVYEILKKLENFWSSPVYWTNNFLNNNPFFVDDEAFRNSGYAVERPDILFWIQEDREGQIHCSSKRGHRITPRGVNTNGEDFEVFTFEFFIQFLHGRHFLLARGTPGGPDIDKNHLAPLIRKTNLLTLEIGKDKVGSWKSHLDLFCGWYG